MTFVLPPAGPPVVSNDPKAVEAGVVPRRGGGPRVGSTGDAGFLATLLGLLGDPLAGEPLDAPEDASPAEEGPGSGEAEVSPEGHGPHSGIRSGPGSGFQESPPGTRARDHGLSVRMAMMPAAVSDVGDDPAAATPAEGLSPGRAVDDAAPPDPGATGGSAPPLRNVEGVHPELVQAVERVVDRMWAELGHRVEVVEGHRPQERQDRLFAQGRTEPGPKVTWTRHSAHTRGEAVDVRIDGGWEDLEAFRRLQVVAREEGLRTLGMKDPGHLELPQGASGSHSSKASGSPGQPGPSPPTPLWARYSAPARVAQVAQVAQVAGVARPGSPLGELRLAEGARLTAPGQGRTSGASGTIPSAAELPMAPGGGHPLSNRAPLLSGKVGGPAGPSLPRGPHGATPEDGRPGVAEAEGTSGGFRESSGGPKPLPESILPRGGVPLELGALRAPAPPAPVAGTGRVSSLLRAEQIRAIQAAAGPGGSLQVELSDVDGRGTDIHLQMRGRGVTAEIGTPELRDVRSLRLRLGELQGRLSDRGLDPERLGVRWQPVEATAPGRDPETSHEGRREEGSARQEGGEQDRREGGSRREEPGAEEFSRYFERRRNDQ